MQMTQVSIIEQGVSNNSSTSCPYVETKNITLPTRGIKLELLRLRGTTKVKSIILHPQVHKGSDNLTSLRDLFYTHSLQC